MRLTQLLKNAQANVDLRHVMQFVPNSVVVVTAKHKPSSLLRGITCSSFVSVSTVPPIISFCMQKPSRMHDILMETEQFAVNVLSEAQANLSIHFSTPVDNSTNQFEKMDFEITDSGLPVIRSCVANLMCNTRDCHSVGDHFVWYGDVFQTSISSGV